MLILLSLPAMAPRAAKAERPTDHGALTLRRCADLAQGLGVAARIEAGGKRILFDPGNNTGTFKHNLEAAGVDPSGRDAVATSHVAGIFRVVNTNGAALRASCENLPRTGSISSRPLHRQSHRTVARLRQLPSPMQALARAHAGPLHRGCSTLPHGVALGFPSAMRTCCSPCMVGMRTPRWRA